MESLLSAIDGAGNFLTQSVGPDVTNSYGESPDKRIDQLTPLQDRLAQNQAVLERAQPMPEGPDDGVVRHGSTVRVRDEAGEVDQFMIVESAELDATAADQVAADSPLGRALLGQRAGSHVAVDAPEGRRVMTILSVESYRAARS